MNTTEAFLKSFHLDNPGCTPAAFMPGKSDGQDSYSFLSSILKDTDSGKSVVDLACGDGTLMKQILNRRIPNIKVTGIDMSPGELAFAKKNLGDQAYDLVEARAQSLPLESGSVDYMFCHMAFMLMGELDTVISEIHRCLKPGGVFSAVVDGKAEISPVFKSFLGLLKQALAEEGKTFIFNLGDKRTKSEDGLKSLFSGENFFDTETKNIQLQFSTKPAESLDFFMLMYDVGLLTSARREQLKLDLLNLLEDNVDSNGRVNHSIWLRQVTTYRR